MAHVELTIRTKITPRRPNLAPTRWRAERGTGRGVTSQGLQPGARGAQRPAVGERHRLRPPRGDQISAAPTRPAPRSPPPEAWPTYPQEIPLHIAPDPLFWDRLHAPYSFPDGESCGAPPGGRNKSHLTYSGYAFEFHLPDSRVMENLWTHVRWSVVRPARNAWGGVYSSPGNPCRFTASRRPLLPRTG